MDDPLYCPIRRQWCRCPWAERCDRYGRMEPATWAERYPNWIQRLMRRLSRLLVIGRDWRACGQHRRGTSKSASARRRAGKCTSSTDRRLARLLAQAHQSMSGRHEMTYRLHRLLWLIRLRLTAALLRADRDGAVFYGVLACAGIVLGWGV